MTKKGVLQHHTVLVPVAISHIASRLSDLYIPGVPVFRVNVNTSAQPNAEPHLGTVTTIMTAFAVAKQFEQCLDLPATVTFDSLENAPGSHCEIGGHQFQKSLADTIVREGQSVEDMYRPRFVHLLEWLAQYFQLPYHFRPYREYVQISSFRNAVTKILKSKEQFSKILSPSKNELHVRFPCPSCLWVEKSAQSLTIIDETGHLQMDCPNHGPHCIQLSTGNHDYFDTGTAVRAVAKGAQLAADAASGHTLQIMVDGADWSGTWALRVFSIGCEFLGFTPHQLPLRFYAPTIVDDYGGKMSKSVYIDDRTFSNYAIRSLHDIEQQFGNEGLEILVGEVQRWAADPRRLHRNYSIRYILDLLESGRS